MCCTLIFVHALITTVNKKGDHNANTMMDLESGNMFIQFLHKHDLYMVLLNCKVALTYI